ncbi:hypothetical protein MLD38_029504 [Melastoma candidum]|uniref:Uncharacterized protein n=1 Tax=Melastoma candidum TaxID=119954 RepID=A0ACB9N6I3_9MYRT|nr:hypothetical protein MLD38_029504 [Melastoma candidum]
MIPLGLLQGNSPSFHLFRNFVPDGAGGHLNSRGRRTAAELEVVMGTNILCQSQGIRFVDSRRSLNLSLLSSVKRGLRRSSYSVGVRGFGVSCAMKSYKLSELAQTEVNGLKARPRIDFSSIFGVVNPIIDDVHSRGDAAVKEYTAKFDKVELDTIIDDVSSLPDPVLEERVKEAFDVAYDNIYAFHLAQKSHEQAVENMMGVRCKRVARCIGSVGLYVPGGTAVLPSTALMLAIPAQIAGCKTVVLATPPSRDGSICKVDPFPVPFKMNILP